MHSFAKFSLKRLCVIQSTSTWESFMALITSRQHSSSAQEKDFADTRYNLRHSWRPPISHKNKHLTNMTSTDRRDGICFTLDTFCVHCFNASYNNASKLLNNLIHNPSDSFRSWYRQKTIIHNLNAYA